MGAVVVVEGALEGKVLMERERVRCVVSSMVVKFGCEHAETMVFLPSSMQLLEET